MHQAIELLKVGVVIEIGRLVVLHIVTGAEIDQVLDVGIVSQRIGRGDGSCSFPRNRPSGGLATRSRSSLLI
jgi:hypothetical protein